MDTAIMTHLSSMEKTEIPRKENRFVNIVYFHPDGEIRDFVKNVYDSDDRDWLLRLLTWAAHSKVEIRIKPCGN